MVICLTTNSLSAISVILFFILSVFAPVRFGAELDWLIIPCGILLIGFIFAKKKIRISNLYIYIFFLYVFFSTGFSRYVSILSDMFSFFVLCSAFVLYSCIEWDEKEIKIFVKVYTALATLASFFIVFNWLQGNYSNYYFQRASLIINGVIKDENYVMGFVVPGIIFALYYFLVNKSVKQRILYGGVLICDIVAVFAAGSRGGMLALVLAVFFMMVYFLVSRKKIKETVLFIVGFIFLLLVIAQFIIPLLPASYIDRLANSSDNIRLVIWKQAFNAFKGPVVLFGGGLHFINEFTYSTIGYYTHNLFLNILLDFGIIGFLSFVFCMVIPNLVFDKKNILITISLIIVFLVPLFFLNGFNSSAFFTPFIMLNILKKYAKNFGNISEVFVIDT